MRAFKYFLIITLLVSGCKHSADTAASAPSAIVCSPSLQQLITFENAAISGPKLTLKNSGDFYTTALKGPRPPSSPNKFQSVKIVEGGFRSLKAIQYTLSPCDVDCDNSNSQIYMQKINHHILYKPGQNLGLDFNKRKYLGFAMKVSQAVFENETILFQIWQGSPFGPPFAAVGLTIGGKNFVKFLVRNQQTGSNPSAVPLEVGRIKIADGEWSEIVVSVFPEHDDIEHRSGNNTLGVFVRNETQGEFESVFEYKGKIGYSPADGCHYAGQCNHTSKPNRKLDFKIGPYRKYSLQPLDLIFDSIKVANTFAAANPRVDCAP